METPDGRAPWRHWGPYLSERAWGTVREDYSADGDAWGFFPFDHARSRAYRWNEDGLGGICDDQQFLCLSFAFWNERDPFLKERIFGLTGPQGNHGEDAKEYWWYSDSTPTHSWMRWRYVYPQAEFPYQQLVRENAARGRAEPEFELSDAGVLSDGRYWDIRADYAKAGHEDLCIRLTVRNAGPDAARIHVLPTVWFRNTWSWGLDDRRPRLRLEGKGIESDHPVLGVHRVDASGDPRVLFCDNESNAARLWGASPTPPYPKDGINDHVVGGAATVNPAGEGTRSAFWYVLEVPAGASAEVRLRLSDGMGDRGQRDLGAGFDSTMRVREKEADEFYAGLSLHGASEDERDLARQALGGMLWSKQFYHYHVRRWLDGDPAQPPPPVARLEGRNHEWWALNNRDVISMPDKWEYPWYASWDLAFQCVALAHVDPGFAKSQLVLLCREWFMHPNGQLPAYEWNFSDVNPPVQAWAALRVFEIDGSGDHEFLERVFHKLLLNFTWWVNRKDTTGNNIFEGGFLGLDNIGPFDRSTLAPGVHLEQSDATAWMALYCLNLLEVALVLADHDPTYEDVATKFFEHFTYIAAAMDAQGLWSPEDSFYYDVLHLPDGSTAPVRARSLVGLMPLCAVTTVGHNLMTRLPDFGRRLRWFIHNEPRFAGAVSLSVGGDAASARESRLLAIVTPDRLRGILAKMLDEDEFLSPHGVRSVSRYHHDHPLEVVVAGSTQRLDYEPAESATGLFGGNSNWRGPVWFPINLLLVESLRAYQRFLGDSFTVECPTGSGIQATLGQVADEISRRLVAIFLPGPTGARPVFGSDALLRDDPAWRGRIPFHEYFDGDTGAGLGASHQTGWTGLVADLLLRRS
ncbi:MAG: MGH1-like glycoside hydrolase domain-containing protein [Candidatus Dormibacteria bacterium]